MSYQNMSYCKWENTAAALRQVANELENNGLEHEVVHANESRERPAIVDCLETAQRLVDLFRDMTNSGDDVEDVIMEVRDYIDEVDNGPKVEEKEEEARFRTFQVYADMADGTTSVYEYKGEGDFWEDLGEWKYGNDSWDRAVDQISILTGDNPYRVFDLNTRKEIYPEEG